MLFKDRTTCAAPRVLLYRVGLFAEPNTPRIWTIPNHVAISVVKYTCFRYSVPPTLGLGTKWLTWLPVASTAYAYGRWGDDYDGDGPSYGDAGYVPGSGDSNGFGDQFGNGIGLEYGTASRYRVIHGTLAALAFVGIFPVGAILIRVIPGRLSYLVHGLVQLLAFIVYICGAALGIYLVKTIRIPPNGQSLVSSNYYISYSTSRNVILGRMAYM